MKRYDSDIISLVKKVVVSMTPVINVDSLELIDGNTKVYTTDTLWIVEDDRINIDGNQVEVTEVSYCEYFIVVGEFTDSSYFQLNAPKFEHGSHRQVNKERSSEDDKYEQYRSFIYLPIPKIDEDRRKESSIAYKANIKPLFLSSLLQNGEKRLINDQQSYFIAPMRAMADIFVSKIEESISVFGDLEDVSEVETMEFGDKTKWGNDKLIFDQPLSGVQNTLNIVVHDFSNCDLTKRITLCAPVSIIKDGVFLENVISGGTYSYTSEADPATVNVNSEFFNTVPAGDSINVPVVGLEGTETGTIVGGSFVVPFYDKIYYNVTPYIDNNYVQDYDPAWWIMNGVNDYYNSIPPGARIQQVDYRDPTKLDRLVYNTINGHKFRFQGFNGGYYNPDDGFYYDVDGNLSDKETEFPIYSGNRYFIIDHLNRNMYIGVRLGVANFTTSLTNINNLTDGGYNDWLAPNSSLVQQLFDPRYDKNFYNTYRPPFDYSLSNFWSCNNAPENRATNALRFSIYNTLQSVTKSSKLVPFPYRRHLTGTIN